MILTDQEAKTKRCCGPYGAGQPSEPYIDQSSIATSVASTLLVPRFCIASACMAWRQVTDHMIEGHSKGYCGLASEPYVSG